jgi:endonuclease YncB( thermonuclease family)
MRRPELTTRAEFEAFLRRVLDGIYEGKQMPWPEDGLSGPVNCLSVTDGDTLVVQSNYNCPPVRIRLKNCWCAELDTAEGLAALKFANEIVFGADELWVWIPPPKPGKNILRQLLTFDRVVGHIFLDSQTTLGEMLIRHGHAFATKGQLKAHLQKKGPA